MSFRLCRSVMIGTLLFSVPPLTAAAHSRPTLSRTAIVKMPLRAAQEHILHAFGGGSDGASPFAGLLAGANGIFYGTTFFGGMGPLGGYGTVFQVTSTQSETILYSFQGATDGAGPRGSVITDGAGDVYGTTFSGADSVCGGGCGIVFKLAP